MLALFGVLTVLKFACALKLHVPESVLSALSCVDVEEITWTSGEPFAAWLTSRKTPVVLTNTLVASWPALALPLELLANRARDGVLHDIYHRKQDNIFSYWHTRPFSRLPELRNGKAQVEQAINVWPNMSSAAFFHRAWDTDAACQVKELESTLETTDFYYSNALDLDFEALRPDLPGLEHLSPTGSLNQSRIMVWIGATDITTPIHNDAFHNLYAQVKGTKRFILFPPTLHRDLHLFPSLHPKHQQSQVLLENISSLESLAIPSYFPNFLTWEKVPPKILVTSLQPGEVLFIPAMWYHHATSLTASFSLNVWTDVDEAKEFEARFQVVDPVASGCLSWHETRDERALSARLYLTHLVEGLLPSNPNGSGAKDFVRDNVLVPRYFPILEQGTLPSFADPQTYRFCGPEEAVFRLSAEFYGCVAAQIEIFRSIEGISTLDDLSVSKLELRLADVVEFSALWAVEAELVSAFLLDFVRC